MNLDVVAKSKINSLIQALSKQVKRYSEKASAERSKCSSFLHCNFFYNKKDYFLVFFHEWKKVTKILHIFFHRILEKIVDNHIYKRVREYIIWAGWNRKKFATNYIKITIINDFETSLLILLLKKTGKW